MSLGSQNICASQWVCTSMEPGSVDNRSAGNFEIKHCAAPFPPKRRKPQLSSISADSIIPR